MFIDTQRAARLRSARDARGLSQAALAAVLNVSRVCIYQLEAGKRSGSVNMWRNLAAALGTSTDWLLDGIGREPVATSQPASKRHGRAAAG